jgi:NAD(P)-dependent dehydrogenase (short-subunit alcohol dehydrogenase family)/acyl carrier protein
MKWQPAPARSQAELGNEKVELGNEMKWQPAPARSQAELGNEMVENPGTWLIFADSEGIGQNLAKMLSDRGGQCVLAFPGQQYAQNADGHYTLNPEEPSDFRRLFAETKQSYRGVIYLWAANLENSGDPDIRSSRLNCVRVLHLVQALAELPDLPRIWLVTRGAHAVRDASMPLQINSSALWGLGKVIALEHPDFRCVCADTDPLADDAAVGQSLWEMIQTEDKEDQIAFRGGVRYAARLVRMKAQTPVSESAVINPDFTYLITGGLGFLGLKLAQWMAEQGGRHLVLVGRGKASPEAAEIIRQMADSGITVMILRGDISDAEDTARVLERVKTEMPELRGIIHCAGLLDDGVLLQQNRERFYRVMTPKIDGAWHLHRLTRDIPLDFFVLFSSIASMIGSPAQGNYAAANAFMDALAHHRRASGLPGLSINWGPWGTGGMVSQLGSRDQARLDRQGMEMIEPAHGLQLLKTLLVQEAAQCGVMAVNWLKFFQQFQAEAEPPLFSVLAGEVRRHRKTGQSRGRASALLRGLESASSEDRQNMLTGHIQAEIAGILELDPSEWPNPQQGFFDMGIDSLMAVDLKTRLETALGQPLSSTLTFKYPTIEALAGYLAEKLVFKNTSSETGENRGADSPAISMQASEYRFPVSNKNLSDILAELEGLSESELEAVINTEFEALLN